MTEPTISEEMVNMIKQCPSMSRCLRKTRRMQKVIGLWFFVPMELIMWKNRVVLGEYRLLIVPNIPLFWQMKITRRLYVMRMDIRNRFMKKKPH